MAFKKVNSILLLFAAFALNSLVYAGPFTGAANAMGHSQAFNRTALVIGNSSYKNVSPLENPVNDANDMAVALEKLGFEVIKGTDADRVQMMRLIRRFGERLAARKGVGLFFYAGHGVEVRRDNYLIPIDADITREVETEFYAIEVNMVLKNMEDAGNGFNIVLLDACRNNPFSRGWNRSGDTGGLANLNAPTGTFIAYAAAPGAVASDGRGTRNGVFTGALLKQMRYPNVKLEDVFKATRADVMAATGNKQVPWTSSSLTGDFYFNTADSSTQNAGPVTAITKAEPPPDPEPLIKAKSKEEQEQEAWDLVKNSSSPQDLRFFLEEFSDGVNSATATAKLEELSWEAIRLTADKRKVEAYLKEFPESANASSARTKLRQMEAETIARDVPEENSEIPSAEPAAVPPAGPVKKIERGNAIVFDGVDDAVDFGILNARNITVEAWVYAEAYGGGIFSNLPGARDIGIAVELAPQFLIFSVGGDGNRLRFRTKESIPLKEWHLISFTYDRKQAKLYIDGKLAGAGNSTRSLNSNFPFVVGAEFADGRFPFKGQIDEVRIWNFALNEWQIDQTRYTKLKGDEEGLVSLWHFDESSGSQAFDSTAARRIGKLVNGPQFREAEETENQPRSVAAVPETVATDGKIRTNKYGMEMIYIPPGEFLRGSDESKTSQPVRKVSFKEGFWIGKFEVMQADWKAVMGKSPSSFLECGPECPVESVSWNDALKFIRKLNESDDGFVYSLPSESEWEYAAAGPGDGPYAASDETAWYLANAAETTHPAGGKAANGFGIYDMVGNVAEWVQDVFSPDYNGLPTDGSANEHIGNKAYRVFRGGSFQDDVTVANARARVADAPGSGFRHIGFRVVARPR